MQPASITAPRAFAASVSGHVASVGAFSKARSLHNVAQTWRAMERVLEVYEINTDASTFPQDETAVASFQQKVMQGLAHPLSQAVSTLFKEHDVAEIHKLVTKNVLKDGDISLDDLRNQGDLIMGDAAVSLLASAELYLMLGNQLEVALEYFASRDEVSDALFLQMKLLFVCHGYQPEFVQKNPYEKIHLTGKLKLMLQAKFDAQLTEITEDKPTWAWLAANHNITPSLMDRIQEAGLLGAHRIPWIMARIAHKSPMRWFGNLMKRILRR